ncbi:Dinitrogenase iron-molybdenum cofactor biosynthesis protein [Rhodomicrobium vannielii ATCC 17100]|jgi:lactoylglutathione lyase|uniref:Dinitrogenase iron-molybdenum cofactor biosynthesis protein n=1 Tax=Rhodomicrobium vannielii (strain ATCC 17100 / DSM 162 / LMG 4299 / NCIMB 10020 / ATH 3.1.1) TaxID=648757 RepID=E3HYQ4_RHOVT|nr:NifB/NifX family molybdenum-iron cluster-binding protein [Rhodomicrobium vannielii]ADP69795.1 Dinitrogenase iron-molybdenum cofactor biosynthesis protein [Rhodomicrobium vannielii ATCC 17100]
MPENVLERTKSETSHAGVIRAAVSTRDGRKINLHFGATDTFFIYDASVEGAVLVEKRSISELALEGEDVRDTACRILADCKVLLLEKVGANPRAMLEAAGIEPIEKYKGEQVETALAAVFAEKAS